MKAVIFDLDGTLVDSAEEIALALNAALFELGLSSLSPEAVQALIGRGVRSLVERALPQAGGVPSQVDAAVERFEHAYDRIVGTRAELFPGVIGGLEMLGHARVPMSVVTNKPRVFTQRLLARLGVERFLTALVAGDDGIPRKPSADMLIAACASMATSAGATLMLGDSDNDVIAARNAGCPVWCVPYGYNEGRGPDTLACDRLVPTVEEAARLILAQA
ncbi:MAG TPA: HAD-IA family hydrolase [Usitatibacter sp.]|nr:HAD-IA family hydrolase [Usitatibacter sp.]